MKTRILLITTICTLFLLDTKGQIFTSVEGTPVTEKENGSRTAGFIDFNGDQLVDLFISNGKSSGEADEVYINKGDDVFELYEDEMLNTLRFPSVGVTWIDIENDGDIDNYMGTWYGQDNYLLLNNEGTMELVEGSRLEINTFTESSGWADLDRDGFLDVAIANSRSTANLLFRNLVNDFEELPLLTVESESRSVNWADYNNDGYQDLLITNEDASPYLYVNSNGVLRDESALLSAFKSTAFGASWVDFDNDGDLDLFLANFRETNSLLENTGDGRFQLVENSGLSLTVFASIGSTWGDVDNDGDLDLYVANGFSSGKTANEFYLNNGDGTFTAVYDHPVIDFTGWSYGVAMGDYNNDGFLDLLIANTYDDSQSNTLFKNAGNANHWIQLDLTGNISNKNAIGARVTLYQSENNEVKLQMRELASTSGYCGINDYRIHFGLGTNSQVDSVIIRWPQGNIEKFYDLEADQIHEIIERMPEAYVRSHFWINQNEFKTDQEIHFINSSKYDREFETTFEWDFDGDGTTDSNEEAPTHVFQEPGTYEVILKISNPENSSEYSRTLKVEKLLGTEDNENDVLLYPNPTRGDQFQITSRETIRSITVYSLSGKLLEEINNIESSTIPVNFPGNESIILLEIKTTSDKTYRKKVLR